jgi:hypothetical protein
LYNYEEVVALRMTRYERYNKKSSFRKRFLVLFFVIMPLLAIIASFFFINIYNRNNIIGTQADEISSDDVITFKYNYKIESKTLYRLELKSSTSLSEAEEYVKSIKAKKLNGFILKEEGYKVIYGIYTNRDQAEKVQGIVAKKVEGNISETKLPGYSLKYNEKDNAFIQLVQASDKLIWEVSAAKSQLSHEIAIQSKTDTVPLVTEIESIQVKLERYLGYAEKVTVSKEQESFRNSFVLMLKEVIGQKLDDGKNYYKIQEGLMNQIKAYKSYTQKLSI